MDSTTGPTTSSHYSHQPHFESHFYHYHRHLTTQHSFVNVINSRPRMLQQARHAYMAQLQPIHPLLHSSTEECRKISRHVRCLFLKFYKFIMNYAQQILHPNDPLKPTS